MAEPTSPRPGAGDDVDALSPAAARAARRARFALERGRLVWGFVLAVPVAAAGAALAVALGPTRAGPVATGALVLVLVTGAGWKSRACLAGCVAGLALGALPFLAMRAGGVACSVGGRCVGDSALVCALGGLLAGLALAAVARRLGAFAAGDVVAGACAGAALHLAVGCPGAGLFEAVGLVGAFLVGAAPVLTLRGARRASAR